MRLVAPRVKLRIILFIACTIIAALPVGLLAVWVTRSAVTKEIDAGREKHLLLAQNLSRALSRYAQDVAAGFQLLVSSMHAGNDLSMGSSG